MNGLFATAFGMFLNLVHLFFIGTLVWFVFGEGHLQFSIPTHQATAISLISLVSYIVFMGALVTLVSIREELQDLNHKLTNQK